MIELRIEGIKVDVKDDLLISFTYETINPDKLSTIKNSFSKTIDIPGTENNNRLFGDLYRICRYVPSQTIEQNTTGIRNIGFQFDPHKKAEFVLLSNGSLVTNGYLTLNNIIVKNEIDITYQVTLYGGIGNFFYNIANIEENNNNEINIRPKKLEDLFWCWRAKSLDLTYTQPLFPKDANEDDRYKEDYATLMTCTTRVVNDSYHKLSPNEEIEEDYDHYGEENYWNEEYQRFYPITDIDKDVVFVPCYTGNYNDFDSNKMLINTANRRYNPTHYMPSDTIDKFNNAFPDTLQVEEDGTSVDYTTLDKNLETSSLFRYGLVTFSRDLDPWEAGDVRVNELPVAIRFSKLMRTISMPWNNGGYDVEWDDEILNSNYWKYSWLMLGKMNVERNSISAPTYSFETQFDNNISFSYNLVNNEFEDGNPYCEYAENVLIDAPLPKGSYDFRITLNPLANMSADFYVQTPLVSGSKDGDKIFNFVTVVVHDIRYDTSAYKLLADVYFYTEDPTNWSLGFEQKEKFEEAIEFWLRGKYTGQYVSRETNFHNITPDVGLEKRTDFDWQGNSQEGIVWKTSEQRISSRLDVPTNLNIRIFQDIYGLFVTYAPSPTTPEAYAVQVGEEPFSFYPPYTPLGNFMNAPRGYGLSPNDWYPIVRDAPIRKIYQNFSFDITEARSGIFLRDTETGVDILKLTKKTLFAEAESPFKYFADFVKMMNYKLICDDFAKKIYVKKITNYYKDDNIVDFENIIDYSREINIKNITTENRRIDFGLQTPETYPIELFNRISRDKFNMKPYDTKVQWNQKTEKLLDNLVYKNSIDWQQSSIFYRLYPQLPRPYNTSTISWTLFNTEGDELKKNEFFTKGEFTGLFNLTEKNDFMPKEAFFDRDNKLYGCGGNLVFLNGFIKNYDYSTIDGGTILNLEPDLIDDNHYIQQSSGGVGGSTGYQIWQYDNIDLNRTYKFSGRGVTGSNQAFINYFDENDQYLGYEYHIADALILNDVTLHPLANTKTIKVNMRKQYESTYKMTSISPKYVISPRVNFSEDTTVQYYLNNKRCYINDFTYEDAFYDWGTASVEQKGTAASWVLPYFTKDLYNEYKSYQEGYEYNTVRLTPIRKYPNSKFAQNNVILSNRNYSQFEFWMPNPEQGWEIDAVLFNASYPDTESGDVLWLQDIGTATIRYEGVYSPDGQHTFVDGTVNMSPSTTTGQPVRIIRMNTYVAQGGDETYYIDVRFKKPIINYKWEPNEYITASWNLVRQDVLEYNNFTNIEDTVFIANPNYAYGKTETTEEWKTNEYTFQSLPTIADIMDPTIFNTRWKAYMDDLYDRNTRDITLYLDLTGLGSPTDILRKIYSWKGFLWIITKIENKQLGQIGKDKFTKCKIHKIYSKKTWTNN